MSAGGTDKLALVLMPADVETAIELLDEREAEKLALYVDEIDRITRAATSKPLANDQDEARAVELVSRGVIAFKDLDGLRKKRVAPLNAEVDAINGLFHKVTDPLTALVGKGGRLEKLILAYRAEKKARLERERAEAERKQREAAQREAEALRKVEAAKTERGRQKAMAEAEAASRAQTEALVAAPPPMLRGVRTDSGSVSERTRLVVQGIHNLDEVPKAYWHDPVTVEALTRVLQKAVTGGVKQIPGVSIGEEQGLTRRTG